MVRKVLVKVFKGIIYFVAGVLLYFLLTFILSKIAVSEESFAKDEIDIFILTNGIHSDIVVPVISEQKNWFLELDFLNQGIDTSKYKYLAIGWGDKGFYLNTPTWAELRVSTALKACVGVSGTAIHASYYENMVENEDCKRIRISKEQYSRLIKFINESFELDEIDNFIQIETTANKGELDAFYEANGRYNIFNTCNSRTNRALKYSGQKACLWTAFQGPIFQKY